MRKGSGLKEVAAELPVQHALGYQDEIVDGERLTSTPGPEGKLTLSLSLSLLDLYLLSLSLSFYLLISLYDLSTVDFVV